MQFEWLHNQSVIEARISDHNPVILGEIASFNVLCQCNIRNNGFRIKENTQQYLLRLNQIAWVIEMLHQHQGINLFALQEMPHRHQAQAFYTRLAQHFHLSEITPTQGTRSALTCLFHKTYYQNPSLNPNFPPEFDLIQGRYQLIDIEDKTAGKITTIMNIHGNFHKQADTIAAVNTSIALGYIVAGDLNVAQADQDKITQLSQDLVKISGFNTIDAIFLQKP